MGDKFIRTEIYFNAERDAPLLAWLKAQKNQSAAIRALMWSHIQDQEHSEASNPGEPFAVDSQAIREVVAEALAESLAAIRQVVEAAVASGLAGRLVPIAPAAEVADETDMLLDALGDNLLVE